MKTLAYATVCFMAALGTSSTAIAGFVGGYAGHSVFGDGGGGIDEYAADGTVSFAVYKNDGLTGNWATDLSLGGAPTFSQVNANIPTSGPMDLSAAYVYMFQIFNTNPIDGDAEDSLNTFRAPILASQPGSVTSAGYISNFVFALSGLAVDGLMGENALGTNTVIGSASDTVGNGSPSEFVDAGNVSLVPTLTAFDISPAAAPILIKKEGGNSRLAFFFPLALPEAQTSPILFFTSNLAPELFLPGRVTDGGLTQGDLPVPNPEPTTIVSVLGALACGLIASARRWNKN